jgi:hypothetical protein
MPTWHALWQQRVRWKRGALENLFQYGFTSITRRYWGRQLVTHIGVMVTLIYLLTIVASVCTTGTVHLHWIWLCITGIFVAERVVTVRRRGRVQMFLASLLVVEMAFDLFLQSAQVKAFWEVVSRTERNWD